MADFKKMRLGLSPVDYTPVFPYSYQAGNGIFLDAPADNVEWRFQAEKSAVITQLGFRVRLTTGQPPTYRVSIQGISNGEANGVIAGSGNFTPGPTYSETSWAYLWSWVNITPTALTQGNFYAIVIDYVSGTINLSNMIEILHSLSGVSYKHFPGAATGAQLFDAHPLFGLKDSTGEVYGNPAQAAYTSSAKQLLQHPQERAIAFTLPLGFGTDFKIAGIQFVGELPTGVDSSTYSLTIYDGQFVIGQLTLARGLKSEGNQPHYTGNTTIFFFDESTLAGLQFGRTYYISIQNNSAAMGSLSWDYFAVLDSDMQEGWPGGQYFFMATRDISTQATDDFAPGDWTIDRSARPICEFILSEWGGPGINVDGAHLKFTPAWNDNVFIQHADDQINKTPDVGSFEPHESYGVPIGNCIESYSGYLTAEVYANPDAERSENYLIVPEQNIEDLKVINLEPWEDGLYELVFRLRAKHGSPYYKEVTRFLKVIT